MVGHGTRDEVGTRQFFELARVLSHHVAPEPVQPCLLELQPPTIREGWRRLVASGVDHVRVLPLLLFTAGHTRDDIPAAVAAAATESPGVTSSISRSLSRHPHIVQLALERLTGTLASGPPLDAESTAVVLVGRGSFDPCARTDMFVLAEVMAARLPVARVETAFYAMCHPPLPEVLERVARDPAIRSIVVQPHLLFEGRLNQAISALVGEAAQRHRNVHFRTSGYLGPDPRVARALRERASQPVTP